MFARITDSALNSASKKHILADGIAQELRNWAALTTREKNAIAANVAAATKADEVLRGKLQRALMDNGIRASRVGNLVGIAARQVLSSGDSRAVKALLATSLTEENVRAAMRGGHANIVLPMLAEHPELIPASAIAALDGAIEAGQAWAKRTAKALLVTKDASMRTKLLRLVKKHNIKVGDIEADSSDDDGVKDSVKLPAEVTNAIIKGKSKSLTQTCGVIRANRTAILRAIKDSFPPSFDVPAILKAIVKDEAAALRFCAMLRVINEGKRATAGNIRAEAKVMATMPAFMAEAADDADDATFDVAAYYSGVRAALKAGDPAAITTALKEFAAQPVDVPADDEEAVNEVHDAIRDVRRARTTLDARNAINTLKATLRGKKATAKTTKAAPAPRRSPKAKPAQASDLKTSIIAAVEDLPVDEAGDLDEETIDKEALKTVRAELRALDLDDSEIGQLATAVVDARGVESAKEALANLYIAVMPTLNLDDDDDNLDADDDDDDNLDADEGIVAQILEAETVRAARDLARDYDGSEKLSRAAAKIVKALADATSGADIKRLITALREADDKESDTSESTVDSAVTDLIESFAGLAASKQRDLADDVLLEGTFDDNEEVTELLTAIASAKTKDAIADAVESLSALATGGDDNDDDLDEGLDGDDLDEGIDDTDAVGEDDDADALSNLSDSFAEISDRVEQRKHARVVLVEQKDLLSRHPHILDIVKAIATSQSKADVRDNVNDLITSVFAEKPEGEKDEVDLDDEQESKLDPMSVMCGELLRLDEIPEDRAEVAPLAKRVVALYEEAKPLLAEHNVELGDVADTLNALVDCRSSREAVGLLTDIRQQLLDTFMHDLSNGRVTVRSSAAMQTLGGAVARIVAIVDASEGMVKGSELRKIASDAVNEVGDPALNPQQFTRKWSVINELIALAIATNNTDTNNAVDSLIRAVNEASGENGSPKLDVEAETGDDLDDDLDDTKDDLAKPEESDVLAMIDLLALSSLKERRDAARELVANSDTANDYFDVNALVEAKTRDEALEAVQILQEQLDSAVAQDDGKDADDNLDEDLDEDLDDGLDEDVFDPRAMDRSDFHTVRQVCVDENAAKARKDARSLIRSLKGLHADVVNALEDIASADTVDEIEQAQADMRSLLGVKPDIRVEKLRSLEEALADDEDDTSTMASAKSSITKRIHGVPTSKRPKL